MRANGGLLSCTRKIKLVLVFGEVDFAVRVGIINVDLKDRSLWTLPDQFVFFGGPVICEQGRNINCGYQ